MNRGEFVNKMSQVFSDLDYNAGKGYPGSEEQFHIRRKEILAEMDRTVLEYAQTMQKESSG